MKLCVGLFGTCGGSKWRDPFMKEFRAQGFEYYNPQVDDWEPWMAKEEAEHLAQDAIILFPVTSETYGLGSLAETGYSILQALRKDRRREFIIMIDDHLDDSLTNQDLRKESMRGRKLIMSHLTKVNFANVHIVSSLEEMLTLSLKLYQAYEILAETECA